jgi:hypothetical protein
MNDGADHQARATLAYLQMNIGDGIESSWNKQACWYEARPQVARWENCREQGYVVHMRNESRRTQINIAWFEHRNSDAICAVRWCQESINSLHIDNAVFTDVYKDKHDVSHRVKCGDAKEMADWIFEQLESHWEVK